MNNKPYNRKKAVFYAHQWAKKRNPSYYNFDKLGGDCTNFVSQVLYSGAGVMNTDVRNGWYYQSASHRSPSWSGVMFLYEFLIHNKEIGPVAIETTIEEIKPGDILQLSFNEEIFGHSLIVVSTGDKPTPKNILLAAHTVDSDYRPLNTYQYKKVRFLHIRHINVW